MKTMDDRLKRLGFKDFVTVDYTGTGDEYLAYQAQKRRRGHYDTWGDDYTPEEGEQLDEGKSLTPAQRQVRARNARKNAKRMQMGKKRASRRAADMKTLMKRARRQAKNNLVKKWTRGKSKSELSFGQRAEMEKKLKKASAKIEKNAKKLLKDVRKADRERLAKGKELKKDNRVSSVKSAENAITKGVNE